MLRTLAGSVKTFRERRMQVTSCAHRSAWAGWLSKVARRADCERNPFSRKTSRFRGTGCRQSRRSAFARKAATAVVPNRSGRYGPCLGLAAGLE